MKRLLAMLACVGLCVGLSVGATGCGKKKDPATSPKPPTSAARTDLSLAVAADPKSFDLKQGKSQDVTITVTRGADLKKDVTLTFDNNGKEKGLEVIEPKDTKVPVGTKTATITIKAGPKATPDTYEVKVTAKADGITPSPYETIKVKVLAEAAAQKDFSLSIGPDAKVTVKQDAKEEVTLGAKLGADLTGAALKAEVTDKDAKPLVKEVDIKVTAAPAKLEKSGDVKVTIAVGAATPPGDYAAVITATPEGGGTPALAKISIKVEAKK